MEAIDRINNAINGVVWGWPTMILLVGTGIFLSVRLGFPQFTKFGTMMKFCLGSRKQKDAKEGSLSSWRSLATALAATVGTGNIVGCTGAIISGGPGAVFWLWVSGIFGMATKYTEVFLAVKNRKRNEAGDAVGGPMYYIRSRFGKVFFAVAGALAAFGIGCLSQISSMSTAINTAVQAFVPAAADDARTISLVIGIATAVILGFVLIGGLKRIGAAADALIPVMSILYILGSLAVIFCNIGMLPAVLRSIFVGAFTPGAVVGAGVGIALKAAVSSGLGRGLFSNEAGQGSAPIAHASSDVEHPAEGGLNGMFEVFFDTIVICSLTCLSTLMSGCGIEYVTGDKNVLPIAAFSTVFGDKLGSLLIAVSLLLFAFSTMVTWSLYGVRCFEFLVKSSRFTLYYRLLFLAAVVYGSVTPLGLAYRISDTLNGLMAIPNLIAILLLSGSVASATKEYFRNGK